MIRVFLFFIFLTVNTVPLQAQLVISPKTKMLYFTDFLGIQSVQIRENEKAKFSTPQLLQSISDSVCYLQLIRTENIEWLLYTVQKEATLEVNMLLLKGKWQRQHETLQTWLKNAGFDAKTKIIFSEVKNSLIFSHKESVWLLPMKALKTYRADKHGELETYVWKNCIEFNGSGIFSTAENLICSDDGQYILAEGDQHFFLWNNKGKLLEFIDARHIKNTIIFSKDSKYLFYEREDHVMVKREIASMLYEDTFKGHENTILCIVEDKQGRLLTASIDGTVKLWNQLGELLQTYPNKKLIDIKFYSDGWIGLDSSFNLNYWTIE